VSEPAPKPRELAIDQFRGLAILGMLIANYLEHVHAVPAWLKHAPDVGLTVVDFVAPFFIFAIGLTFGASVQRRLARDGVQRTLEHFLKRALALVGIGALFSIGEQSYGFAHGPPWGTLQAIGVAIALSLPALWLTPFVRLAVALALMAGYQAMLAHGWLPLVLASSHAGLQGALSWGALLMLATVFADLRERHVRYLALGAALLGAGLALAPLFPVSKHRMSISFDLIVGASGALAFALVELWVAARGAIPALVTWGRNPLVLYVSHLILLSVFLVPAAPWWHVEAPLPQVLVQGVAFVGVLHRWARFLERRRVFIAL
jgi:predicted acyltransferase